MSDEEFNKRMREKAREYNSTKFGSKIDFIAGYKAGMSDPDAGQVTEWAYQSACRAIEKHREENRRLKEAMEICIDALNAIGYHDGFKVIGISRNKAVEGFEENAKVSRKALSKLKALGIVKEVE